MTVMTFDELNQLVPKQNIPMEQYFGEMGLTNEQERKRLDLAERLEEEFIDILAWVFYTAQNRAVSESVVEERFREALLNSTDEEVMNLSRTEEIIDTVAKEVAKTTVDRRNTPFFLSEERAYLLAEDNANTLFNYYDFEQALTQNKSMKQWLTILDGRERQTHNLADGMIAVVEQPFEVGDSLLMFPKDTSLGASPEEIIGCRCSVRYF